MHVLAELVRAREGWLIERVLTSARRLGYTRYTSTLLEAWRASIQGLSEALIQSLSSTPYAGEFSPDYDPVQDPVAYYGIIEAQRHRARGVSLEQFLGLLSYYRQAYYDLLSGRDLPLAQVRQGRKAIESFFDRIQLGISSEWSRVPQDHQLDDMRRTNRALTNEKNRLLTVIESLPVPVLYFDLAGSLQLFNRAAKTLLAVDRDANDRLTMGTELNHFVRTVSAGACTEKPQQLLRPVPTRQGARVMLVQLTPMLDLSGKFSGMLLSCVDQGENAAAISSGEELIDDSLPVSPPKSSEKKSPPALAVNPEQKYRDLTLLYRVSNTMLTTIRLNKLIHLILTALTAGDEPFFDRAVLFMTNERSGFMQGMLGVTRETSVSMAGIVTDPTDILGSGWDLSEEVMLRQQNSAFSRLARASRVELDKRLNVSSRAVLEKRLIYIRDVAKEKRVDRVLLEQLGILKSFAVAPLIAKEKVFGIVLVDNSLSGRRINQAELGFLQIFTNQAGVAIENALLYSRLEEANRNLREAQERLIHGERLATIGEMAASLAHELKGPLVSIGGFANRLLKSLPDAGMQHDSAEMIAREVMRLEKLLGDILSFGRKTTLCYDHWIVQDMVEESLAVVAPTCAEQRVEIRRKFPSRPIPIMADGQQLKQVFLNLFFNAQEVMAGKGGGTLSVSIALSRLRGCPAVTIKVADTGGGVPEHQLHSIFAAFYTTKEAGTGLGLPIAHRIVTNHRGTIQARNVADKGLEFTLALPLQP